MSSGEKPVGAQRCRPPTPRLHFEDTGPSTAPSLLFSGSLATTLAMWDTETSALAGRYRVIRHDHLGHGKSPDMAGPPRVETMARAVLDLLDRLGIARTAFCGLSLGGMVGMWLAAEAPDRVSHLILCCTTPQVRPGLWDDRMRVVGEAGTAAVAEVTVNRWLSPDFGERRPDMRRKIADMVAETPDRGYLAACEAMAEMNLWPLLERIRADTLVLAGERDPAAPPAMALQIAEAIRRGGARAEVRIVPQAGHLVNIEQPRLFLSLLEEHLAS